MLFLNQDALQSHQLLHGQLLLNEISVKTTQMPNASFDMTLFHDEDRLRLTSDQGIFLCAEASKTLKTPDSLFNFFTLFF